jgi:hypothetical protein
MRCQCSLQSCAVDAAISLLVVAAAVGPYLNSLDGRFCYDDKVGKPADARAFQSCCVAHIRRRHALAARPRARRPMLSHQHHTLPSPVAPRLAACRWPW